MSGIGKLSALAIGVSLPGMAVAAPAGVELADALVIHAGAVVTIPGEKTLGPSTIVVRGGRIAEIESGYVEHPGAKAIDLKGRTLLPGLIDTHVHFSFSPATKLWSAAIDTPEDVAIFAFSNAKKTLEAGFTTVRDVGSDGYSIHALRDAVNEGIVTGPRIFLSGTSLSIVGGHGDMSGLNRKATEALYPYDYTGACTGGVECALRVREAAKYGADLIKITSTGGIMSQQARGLGQHLSEEELNAIVTTAHSLGLKVAAHAHGGAGVAASVRAGVDSIEHGTWLDEETAKEMAKRGTWLVPTLGLLDGRKDADASPEVQAKMAEARAVAGRNIALAVHYKVNIAFGTDAGVSPHGENARQFRHMVEQGPMTPAAAIRSATVDAAALLGQSENVGTIEVGKFADLIAVDGDPYRDVTLLERVSTVIKGGQIVVQDGRAGP
ncbi:MULTISPECIES: amidohydrolase family protein [unclassified Sphingopyxis]|uniref:metal-dependent hydrolase family protein n=1 Tax=unclassified Sphingopyxis TaxID=2614943 RepID=UPI0024ACF89C|nr:MULTISPECIES: amidohydrolase family protein [unclassified Sphingopyxis]